MPAKTVPSVSGYYAFYALPDGSTANMAMTIGKSLGNNPPFITSRPFVPLFRAKFAALPIDTIEQALDRLELLLLHSKITFNQTEEIDRDKHLELRWKIDCSRGEPIQKAHLACLTPDITHHIDKTWLQRRENKALAEDPPYAKPAMANILDYGFPDVGDLFAPYILLATADPDHNFRAPQRIRLHAGYVTELGVAVVNGGSLSPTPVAARL